MNNELWQMIQEKSRVDESRFVKVPNSSTLSYWTYADMKREFEKSMSLFSENGFADESAELAHRCVKLALYREDREQCGKIAEMTENIMADTLCILNAKTGNTETLGKLKESDKYHKSYEEHIAAYKKAAHGAALSRGEQEELLRDIDRALEILRGCDIPKKNDNEEIELEGCKSFNMNYDGKARERMRSAAPPADADKRIRERLSDRAYALLTEYKRGDKITSIDFLENEYLKPNGLELTDELREFVELYDGRDYAWRAPMFFIDFPMSMSWFKGYSIELELTWTGSVWRGDYYIPTMSENIAPYTGPSVGSDGLLHFWSNGYWYDYPDVNPITPEEFFEREARERFKDELLIKRRCELENKYLIPEIRTASM